MQLLTIDLASNRVNKLMETVKRQNQKIVASNAQVVGLKKKLVALETENSNLKSDLKGEKTGRARAQGVIKQLEGLTHRKTYSPSSILSAEWTGSATAKWPRLTGTKSRLSIDRK
jgi:hypothetical protein